MTVIGRAEAGDTSEQILTKKKKPNSQFHRSSNISNCNVNILNRALWFFLAPQPIVNIENINPGHRISWCYEVEKPSDEVETKAQQHQLSIGRANSGDTSELILTKSMKPNSQIQPLHLFSMSNCNVAMFKRAF